MANLKDSGEKLYGSRSRQLSHQLPQKESEGRLWLQISKRIRLKIIWLQVPPTLFISSLKKNPAKIYIAPDPANFLISSLKKNPMENYMAPDPANFLHQLSQKESGKKLYGSRSRQLSHQLPQKESGGKLYGSRSRQLSSSAPSKRIWQKIIWLQIPPTFCIISLKKNLAENNMAPDPANNLLISSGLMKSQLKTPKQVK